MNKNQFLESIDELGIDMSKQQLEQLNKYYDLLIEWNNKINLTSIIEEDQVYLKHFYDSATVVKVIDLNGVENLCDIGSGAGFPGIVLKILFPHLKITLVDTLNKRINFLNFIIEKLDLKEIETSHSRIEEYALKNRQKYDIVTARAVAHLSVLLEYSIPMVKIGGYFIAMKANIVDELKESSNALKILSSSVVEKISFQLPQNGGLRTLVKVKKNKITPGKYPRKYSDIKKKRL